MIRSNRAADNGSRVLVAARAIILEAGVQHFLNEAKHLFVHTLPDAGRVAMGIIRRGALRRCGCSCVSRRGGQREIKQAEITADTSEFDTYRFGQRPGIGSLIAYLKFITEIEFRRERFA